MNELLINGENAYTTWGVRMGEGFLDVIGASAPMKDFIENKSRLEHEDAKSGGSREYAEGFAAGSWRKH